MKRQKNNPRTLTPVDFEFDKSKGKFITVKTIDSIQSGTLVEFIDNMLTLQSSSKNGLPVIYQFDYSEIQTIILN